MREVAEAAQSAARRKPRRRRASHEPSPRCPAIGAAWPGCSMNWPGRYCGSVRSRMRLVEESMLTRGHERSSPERSRAVWKRPPALEPASPPTDPGGRARRRARDPRNVARYGTTRPRTRPVPVRSDQGVDHRQRTCRDASMRPRSVPTRSATGQHRLARSTSHEATSGEISTAPSLIDPPAPRGEWRVARGCHFSSFADRRGR